MIAKSVEYDAAGQGHTQDLQSKASVDREPLVRVMLKNGKGDIMLDGYILLHICHTQDNATAVVRAQDKEFNLCDPLAMETTWAEFDKEVLQNTLGHWEIEAFNRTYHADAKVGTTAVPANEERFVTPYAFFVGTTPDGQSRGYELKVYNFGNIYGNAADGSIAKPVKTGGAEEDNTCSVFQDKGYLGNVVYYLNASSPTNHVIRWTLNEEEVEYLTHHAKSYPVTVTRWVRWKAKDDVDGRESNTYSDAPYRYIWLQLTMKITRDQNIVYYEEKTNNFWYDWNPDGKKATADVEKGWSATISDIMAPGSTLLTTEDKHWDTHMSDRLTENYIRLPQDFTPSGDAIAWHQGAVNLSGSKVKVGNYDKRMKYYFAPKTYTIKGLSGTVYTITPQKNSSDNDWKRLYCKYIYKHTYDNSVEPTDNWTDGVHTNGSLVSYFKPKVKITKDDYHTWVGAWNASTLQFDWSGSDADYRSEEGLKTLMTTCATDYNKGMFNNTILYAKVGNTYTPIAEIMQQEQDGRTAGSLAATKHDAGQIRLIHWLPSNVVNTTENIVLYDILNALGYPMKADGTCDYDYAQKYINQQFRSWVGLVANNGCDVAKFVEQALHEDHNIATYLVSWQRPINLKTPSLQNALDANTNENTLYLLDNLKLFDWRGDYDGKGDFGHNQGYMYRVSSNMADNHYWFWAYYNVKGISLDMRPSVVKTNMHQADTETFVTLDKVSSQLDLWAGKPYMTATKVIWGEGWTETGAQWKGMPLPNVYNVDASNWGLVNPNEFYYQEKEAAIEEYMGIYPLDWAKKLRFGSIYYQNNNPNVTEFDIIVPVEIFYEWGSLKETIRWHIDTTHGHNPEI